MSTKKMVLALIITAMLFMLFLGFALKKIQTVAIDIRYIDSFDSVLLDGIASGLLDYGGISLDNEKTIEEMPVILLDHLSQAAYYVKSGEVRPINYALLDATVKTGNHYSVYVKDEPTVVMNCDPILGDGLERTIARLYINAHKDVAALSPGEVNYFQTIDENVEERFYRNKMVETLREAYMEVETLEPFNFYYKQWADLLGEPYMRVLEYDYYDGLDLYFTYKAKQLIKPDYTEEMLYRSYVQESGLILKEDEYRLLGFYWNMIAERQGLDLFTKDDMRADRYKLLLKGTPYHVLEYGEELNIFKVLYEEYNTSLVTWVSRVRQETIDVSFSSLELQSETYLHTLQVSDEDYLYFDYKARLASGEVISQEIMESKVLPYKLTYKYP